MKNISSIFLTTDPAWTIWNASSLVLAHCVFSLTRTVKKISFVNNKTQLVSSTFERLRFWPNKVCFLSRSTCDRSCSCRKASSSASKTRAQGPGKFPMSCGTSDGKKYKKICQGWIAKRNSIGSKCRTNLKNYLYIKINE